MSGRSIEEARDGSGKAVSPDDISVEREAEAKRPQDGGEVGVKQQHRLIVVGEG